MSPVSGVVLRSLGDYVEVYEAARIRDGFADLAAFLPPSDDVLYLPVLRELVRVELEYGWEYGQPRRLAEYRTCFPELFSDPESLQWLTFEEFRLRLQAGDNPSAEEYERGYGVCTRSWPAVNGQTKPAAADPANAEAWAELQRSDPGTAERLRGAVARLPQAGDEFLGFRLHAELGRGAFGRVFLAQQDDLAQRWVALKIAPDLWNESQTLAQLQHTHIVPIYSVHRTGPLHAVCMPFFGATTLAHVLKDMRGSGEMPSSGKSILHTLDARRGETRLDEFSGPPSGFPSSVTSPAHPAVSAARPADPSHLEGMTYIEAVLALAVRIAEALAHAHERGILHRDLKPANILLTDDGQPMLLDFNLSADMKNNRAARAHVGGTLPYMAPEHLEAFREGKRPVDARADLFSLGVILFELLTGQHPFPLRWGPLAALLPEMVADRSRPAPSLRTLNPSVSPAVEAIVRHCLDPDPTRRYASARELTEDLRRHLEHRPLRHLREPSWRERFAKWRRRHPRMTSGTAVGLVAVVVGLTAMVAYLFQQKRDAHFAFTHFLGEFQQARHALNVPDDHPDIRSKGADLSREIFNAYGVLNSPDWLRERPARYLSDGDRGRLSDRMGELLLQNARVILREASSKRESKEQGELLRQVRELHRAAETCYPIGETPRVLWLQRAEAAQLAGDEAAAHDEQERAAAQPLRAFTDHAVLAMTHLARGEHRKALDLLEQIRSAGPHDYGSCLMLARSFQGLREPEKVEMWFQQAILLNPSEATAYLLRGTHRLQRKQYEPACADFDQVLRLQPGHDVASYNRARARLALRNLDGALEDLDRAIQREKPRLSALLLRARIHELRGKADLAKRDREEALRREPVDARDWSARAEERAAREPEAALADLEKAISLNARHVETWQSHAHVLDQLGRAEDAIASLDRALALEPNRAAALSGRGVLRARLGKRESALADAKTALAASREPETLYQVGCIYALTSRAAPLDRGPAIKLLSAALSQGYGLDLLATDHDLDPLRTLPEFKRILEAALALRGRR